MNNFTKTILAFSLVASSQTYSMFRVARPVTQNSQHLMRRALLKRLMSTAKDSQVKQLSNAELQEELKLARQELEKLNNKIKEEDRINTEKYKVNALACLIGGWGSVGLVYFLGILQN